MRTLMTAFGLIGVTVLSGLAAAQDAPAVNPAPVVAAPSEAPKFPKSPLNVAFTTLGTVDLDNGTVEYVVTKPVYETKTREITETVVGPDGAPRTVTKQVQVTVCVCVPELRQMRIEGALLTNTAGKKMPFVEAAKKLELKGRDVIIAQGGMEIDPYFLKFFAKDVLILVPAEKPPELAPPAPGLIVPPATIPPRMP